MKAYVATTGIIFGLITAAHIARMFSEGALWRDPFFVVLTLMAVLLCPWAVSLLRRWPELYK